MSEAGLARGTVAVTAELAWVELDGVAQLARRPRIRFERPSGRIVDISLAEPPTDEDELVFDLGRSLLLPGMVNAHSHAFQRMIRGVPQGQPPAGEAPASFWSWRGAMYEAANSLDPSEVYAQTRACFSEMLDRGITCVGEFHYLHHQADGQPYDDPNELSQQVIRAAQSVGLRLCLLEVYYARAGFEQPGPLPEQRRFCDGSVDAYLARVEALVAGSAEDPRLSVGLAPHSVRAVPAPAVRALASYANTHGLPLHAHVSEQVRENQQCRAEHGMTPLQVLADAGAMTRPGGFTAVHAIHVETDELALMNGQQICACPTTEADLGDGIVPARAWREAGARLALGSDSNAVIDLIQEARLLEMNERLAHQARLRLVDARSGRVAPALLHAATRGGAASLGLPELGRLTSGSPFDAVAVDLAHPSLRDVSPELALDALLLAGTAAPVAQVWVGGERLR